MSEIPDDVITELIAAIVAARADGGGVMTIGAVRARLKAAKLYVARLEAEGEEAGLEDQLRDLVRKRQQQQDDQ